MRVIVALHKPCGVLSRFTADGSKNRTLATLGLPPGVFPVGRLDADSEGLLLLSDEPWVTTTLHDAARAHVREYWVQVEREIDDDALRALAAGVVLDGRRTRRARARRIDDPGLPARDPPIRFRKSVPTSWIALELSEGKNRQVRRMTAAVGFPTLRLYRARVGGFNMPALAPGAWSILDEEDTRALFAAPTHEHDDDAPLAQRGRSPATRGRGSAPARGGSAQARGKHPADARRRTPTESWGGHAEETREGRAAETRRRRVVDAKRERADARERTGDEAPAAARGRRPNTRPPDPPEHAATSPRADERDGRGEHPRRRRRRARSR